VPAGRFSQIPAERFLQTLHYYFGWNGPWGILTVLLTAGAVVMMVRGVAISTKAAGMFFGFELLILVIVSIGSLVSHSGHLSSIPFDPSHILHGFWLYATRRG
jgi:amino acid transporter